MIETERLFFRNYCQDDFDAVHEYASDPTFSRFQEWGPNTEQDTRSFIEKVISQSLVSPQMNFEFAVCLKDSNQLIGGCSICLEDQKITMASIGYAINPKYQNKGYATELGLALLDYGFSYLKLSVIWAGCDIRNHASYKVMEKLGMQRVGKIEKNRRIEGELRDSYRYEMTNEAYKRLTGNQH